LQLFEVFSRSSISSNEKPHLAEWRYITGATGLAFLREAICGLEPLPKVIAYVRTPDKIPPDLAQKIKIVQGDLRDSDASDKALQGADVFVSFLGPSEVSLKKDLYSRPFSCEKSPLLLSL
jgi:putative NADH-flavin reductase